MRKASPKDYPKLATILASKGLEFDDMAIFEYESWIEEENGKVNGFFTVRPYAGLLFLEHFWAGENRKNPGVFRRMAKKVKELVRTSKRREFIVNAPMEDHYVRRFVETYLRTKAYAAKDGNLYYLAGAN
jgi:hypothetical protein